MRLVDGLFRRKTKKENCSPDPQEPKGRQKIPASTLDNPEEDKIGIVWRPRTVANCLPGKPTMMAEVETRPKRKKKTDS